MDTPQIRRIIAGVDFSDWMNPVLDIASAVAGQYGADLSIVHADRFLPPPYFTQESLGKISQLLKDEKLAAGDYLRSRVQKRIGDRLHADTRIIEAGPVEGLLQTAEDLDAQMIIVGTHGRGGVNRFLLGSVAENVLRASTIPVMTVREGGTSCNLPPRRILCPLNDTAVAQQALQYATDMARRFGAELLLMTSVEQGRKDRAADTEKLCSGVPDEVRQHCAIKPIVTTGNAAEQIMRTARDERVDLVVIGAQHTPLMETTIFGTTTIRVVRHATCPVLSVVRAHDTQSDS